MEWDLCYSMGVVLCVSTFYSFQDGRFALRTAPCGYSLVVVRLFVDA